MVPSGNFYDQSEETMVTVFALKALCMGYEVIILVGWGKLFDWLVWFVFWGGKNKGKGRQKQFFNILSRRDKMSIPANGSILRGILRLCAKWILRYGSMEKQKMSYVGTSGRLVATK